MEKTELRRKILEAGIRQHQSVIDDFRQRIKDMMATEGTENEEEYDSQTLSQKAITSAEAGLLTDQLHFANRELDELRKINPEAEHQRVEYGSVVKTNRETFFVSASIERFFADGKPFFGLSVHTPLYKVMRGKKAGESFSYNDAVYVIEEIF